MPAFDAVIVGAGPNGLSAAIRLQEKGKRTLVLEAEDRVGGAARSGALTLSGFIHDLGSAIHPLAIASPYLKSLPLEKFGLEWIHPRFAVAHPLDDGTAVVMARSIEETARRLGEDEGKYREIYEYFRENREALFSDVLAPLRFPKHPLLMSRFGVLALLSAKAFAGRFREEKSRALFAGLAAHSFLKLDTPFSAAIGLVLGIAAHGEGWPLPRGGAGKITEAMSHYFQSLGGTVRTGIVVERESDISDAKVVLFDVHPRQILKIAGSGISDAYRKSIVEFKPGPGVFKLDWAMSGPIPWRAQECAQAGTVHLGGSFEEIAESEGAPWKNSACERPFVLLSQPTVFDPSRAPEGKHVVWAYCHVPLGSTADMTDRIEAQIERFAPGFKDRILMRAKSFPSDLQRQNRNLIGGDISGGAPTPRQLFFRPALGSSALIDPYRIPGDHAWWLCSSSSPPGAGVHGMCGFHAAEAALKRGF